MFVDFFVDNVFTASFVSLAGPLILWNIGYQAVIDTGLASFLAVEGSADAGVRLYLCLVKVAFQQNRLIRLEL